MATARVKDAVIGRIPWAGDRSREQKSQGVERRSEPRFPFQTVVTHVAICRDEVIELKKCWTRDLSPGGARIMSLEPLQGERLLLRFLLPRLGNTLIDAVICSQTEEQQIDMHRRSTTMYLYGVRFETVLGEEMLADRTQKKAASETPPTVLPN